MRSRDDNGGGLGPIAHMFVMMILQMLLFIPGSMLIAYFSRLREYRADQGGAKLAGREKMISALRSLQRVQEINMSPEIEQAPAYASMKISAVKRSTIGQLFSTHPALEDRIARLERGL